MSDRKIFTDSISPLPQQIGPTASGLMVAKATPEHRSTPMDLLFSLDMPGQADLESRVAKGEVIPADEIRQKYSPNKSDAEALAAWLKGQGFTVDKISPDGSGVYATASAGQIEQSLAVKMVRVTKNGIEYTAAQNAPSLPGDIGAPVHAIIGLQPFRHANKHSRMHKMSVGNRSTLLADGSLSPNTANEPPYLVPEIMKAYGADGLNLTGDGQTIAILIDTVPNDADLIAFWRANGIAADIANIQKINVTGATLPPPEGEETLDVEWSSGVAPKSKIRIYATGTLQFVDLNQALDQILEDLPSRPGMRQLSISLGLGETYMGGPQGLAAAQHQRFLKLAASGVNIFVSSGDAGSNPDATGHSPTGPLQAEYASSDPTVIGVGGTSLRLAADGSVTDEVGWTSGGGGRSIFFPRPAWQTGNGVPAGGDRLVPDVSLAADPNEGALLVLNNSPIGIGGTSWSAPVWAGFCALINQSRVASGAPALPFLNPLIYPLMGTACFHDINEGSNGAYEAGPGYDLVTGIGVPNVRALIAALTQGQAQQAAAASTSGGVGRLAGKARTRKARAKATVDA
jgi:kumamolisin